MPSPQRGRADGSTPAAQPQPEGREGPQARSGVEAAGRPRSHRTSETSSVPSTNLSQGCTLGASVMWRTRRPMDCAPSGATTARTQAAGLAPRLALPALVARPAALPPYRRREGRQQRNPPVEAALFGTAATVKLRS